jgi:hypothetical protein
VVAGLGGRGVRRYWLMGTEFQFEKMKMFQRQMVVTTAHFEWT